MGKSLLKVNVFLVFFLWFIQQILIVCLVTLHSSILEYNLLLLFLFPSMWLLTKCKDYILSLYLLVQSRTVHMVYPQWVNSLSSCSKWVKINNWHEAATDFPSDLHGKPQRPYHFEMGKLRRLNRDMCKDLLRVSQPVKSGVQVLAPADLPWETGIMWSPRTMLPFCIGESDLISEMALRATQWEMALLISQLSLTVDPGKDEF